MMNQQEIQALLVAQIDKAEKTQVQMGSPSSWDFSRIANNVRSKAWTQAGGRVDSRTSGYNIAENAAKQAASQLEKVPFAGSLLASASSMAIGHLASEARQQRERELSEMFQGKLGSLDMHEASQFAEVGASAIETNTSKLHNAIQKVDTAAANLNQISDMVSRSFQGEGATAAVRDKIFNDYVKAYGYYGYRLKKLLYLLTTIEEQCSNMKQALNPNEPKNKTQAFYRATARNLDLLQRVTPNGIELDSM
jgi:hypothetical protein